MPGPIPYRDGFGTTRAPACDIALSWRGKTVTVTALVDSGASGTLIPRSAVDDLALAKIGERGVRGIDSPSRLKPMYRVNIDFLGLLLENHAVTLLEDREFALVGRDILNRYRTLLNGPALEFSVE